MRTESSTERTVTQQMQAYRDQQAQLRLDAEVRSAALRRGAAEEKAAELVTRARQVFLVEDGHARPVKPDGKTPWRRPDGWLITVEDWVAASLSTEDMAVSGTLLPQKNPFKRETWNLTEQMRLQKQNPQVAAQLRDA